MCMYYVYLKKMIMSSRGKLNSCIHYTTFLRRNPSKTENSLLQCGQEYQGGKLGMELRQPPDNNNDKKSRETEKVAGRIIRELGKYYLGSFSSPWLFVSYYSSKVLCKFHYLLLNYCFIGLYNNTRHACEKRGKTYMNVSMSLECTVCMIPSYMMNINNSNIY